MFICDRCLRATFQNPPRFSKSSGRCEWCEQTELCSDIQSGELLRKPKSTELTTIENIRVGDRVQWFSPHCEGTVADVDYCTIQIRWDDGSVSNCQKADGFIGWKAL